VLSRLCAAAVILTEAFLSRPGLMDPRVAPVEREQGGIGSRVPRTTIRALPSVMSFISPVLCTLWTQYTQGHR